MTEVSTTIATAGDFAERPLDKVQKLLAGTRRTWPLVLSVGAHLAVGAVAWTLRPAPGAPVKAPVSVVVLSVAAPKPLAAPGPVAGPAESVVEKVPAPQKRRPRRAARPAAVQPAAPERVIAPAEIAEPAPRIEISEPAAEAMDGAAKETVAEGAAAVAADAGHAAGAGTGAGGGGGSGSGMAEGDAVDVRAAAIAPKVLAQARPDYPRRARSQGIEGLVVLRLVVGRDGRVDPAYTKVVRSIPALDAAAIEAVHGWRFAPARDGAGRPLRVVVQIPVRFALS